MAKRVPPEVRAAAVASVATGEVLSEVARRSGVSKAALSEWCKEDLPNGLGERSRTAGEGIQAVRDAERVELIDLVEELVINSVKTLSAQARFASRDDWLSEQDAAGLAAYRGVEFDRIIRLLAAFRPAEPEQSAVIDIEPGRPE